MVGWWGAVAVVVASVFFFGAIGWRFQMNAGKVFWRSGCAFVLAGILFGVLYAQRPFRRISFRRIRRIHAPAPDWKQPAEWTFARLMYPPGPLDGYRGRFDGDWRQGSRCGPRIIPRADRAFAAGGPAVDAHRCAVGGTVGESGRWRRDLQLALALCRAGGRVGPDRGPGEEAARLSAARRLLHGRRFSRSEEQATSKRR